MTPIVPSLSGIPDGGDRSVEQTNSPAAVQKETGGKLRRLRYGVTTAVAALTLFAADAARPAPAIADTLRPTLVAGSGPAEQPVLPLLVSKGFKNVRINARDQVAPATNFQTMADLGKLVPGGADIKSRKIHEILGVPAPADGDEIGLVTAVNITKLFDEATDYRKHPELVDFRRDETDGKPIFQKWTFTAMPWKEPQAQKILADIDTLRRNAVTPMLEGKVSQPKLAEWAAQMSSILIMTPENLHSFWAISRLGPGFLVEVESAKRDYARVISKEGNWDEYFAPKGEVLNRAVINSTSIVEALRFMQLATPTMTTYKATVSIGGLPKHVNVADIGNANDRKLIADITGLPDDFLRLMQEYARLTAMPLAIDAAVNDHPAIQAAIREETGETARKLLPRFKSELESRFPMNTGGADARTIAKNTGASYEDQVWQRQLYVAYELALNDHFKRLPGGLNAVFGWKDNPLDGATAYKRIRSMRDLEEVKHKAVQTAS